MDWGSFFGGAAKQGNIDTELDLRRQEIAKRDEQFNKSHGLAVEADKRTSAMHALQLDAANHAATVRTARDAFNKKLQARVARVRNGDLTVLDELEPEYNSNQGWANDGTQMVRASTPNGQVASFIKDGKVLSSHPVNQETAMQALMQAAMMEQAMLPGGDVSGYYQGERKHGLENRKVASEEGKNTALSAYYTNRANDPDTVSNGSWIPDGKGGYRQLYNATTGASGGANSQNWQAFGTDKDGTPVLLNTKRFDPASPGTGLVRVDGKPVTDITSVYKSRSGIADKQVDPKQRQEIIKLVRENNPNFDALPKADQDSLLSEALGTSRPSLVVGGKATVGKPEVVAPLSRSPIGTRTTKFPPELADQLIAEEHRRATQAALERQALERQRRGQ